MEEKEITMSDKKPEIPSVAPGLPMNKDRCVTFDNGVTIQYAPSECVDALLERMREIEAKAKADADKNLKT